MSAPLTADLITEPRIHRLLFEVKAHAIEVVVYAPTVDGSLIYRRISLDPAAASHLAAIESAVYENPLLLADFDKVYILMDTPRFMLVPSEIEHESTLQGYADAFWYPEKLAVSTDTLPLPGTRLMMALEPEVLAFLRRTYPGASLMHPVSSLISYFHSKDRLNNTSRMYVHLHQGRTDIICFDQGRLMTANTFATPSADDVLYYIMLVAQQARLDIASTEVFLSGEQEERPRVLASLKEFTQYAMPVLFPSTMYQAGKEALDSPFELIIMPLCV